MALFSSFAVIVTLSASYMAYTTIQIYAAMKAIDASMFERRSISGGLMCPVAPDHDPARGAGIFIAMILVYLPMLTDFVTADIVGGTG